MSETTVDSWNRRRDAERLAKQQPLMTESGRDDALVVSLSGTVVARGYTRVVFGDHGPYVELSREQVCFESLPDVKRKCAQAYYDELRTADGAVLVYEQRRDVRGLPNPPRGPWSARNNRPEGYADYRVGMFYVDPDEVRLVLNKA